MWGINFFHIEKRDEVDIANSVIAFAHYNALTCYVLFIELLAKSRVVAIRK